MSVNGVRMFRYALIAEAGMNLASVVPMLIDPSYILEWLVESPDQITPAACALTQWCGCIVAGLTVPIILSIPHTPEAPSHRKLLYKAFAATEVALGTAMGVQYLRGDSGLKSEALWSSMRIVGAFSLSDPRIATHRTSCSYARAVKTFTRLRHPRRNTIVQGKAERSVIGHLWRPRSLLCSSPRLCSAFSSFATTAPPSMQVLVTSKPTSSCCSSSPTRRALKPESSSASCGSGISARNGSPGF